jgi:hypothetical protein
MIPSDHFFLGGGAANTAMTPVAAVLLILAVAMILFGPRRYIVAPLLLAVFLVPSGNVVVLAGVHLMPIRILAPAGWLRLVMSKRQAGESRFAFGYSDIDRAFLGFNIVTAVAVFLQWLTVSAITNQLGELEGMLGMYFLLRQLIRNQEDVAFTIKVMVMTAVVSVAGMINEHLTLHNAFGTLIGGVQTFPLVREGRIRSEGPFQHAILAGVFGATTLPLSLWLFKVRRSYGFAVTGILAGTGMVLLCASSTPVMAYAGTIFVVCLWPIRRSMQLLRRGLSFTLIALHMVMKAPVWFLIARVDIIGGSASFDRANLIDTCVRHFSAWWLYGTHDTGNWGWSMWDLSDQFVSVAETGGLLAIILFIAVISRSFGRLGKARKALAAAKKDEWGPWFLGAAVFANILAYFGVSYFDQTVVSWYVLLSVIVVVTSQKLPEEIREPALWESVSSPLLAEVGSDSAESIWWTPEGLHTRCQSI